MSSADTLLNIAGISFVKLWKKELWRRCTEEGDPADGGRSLLKFLRLSILGVGVLSVIIALSLPDLVNLLVGAFAMLLICTPAILAAIFTDKPNEKAAFHSMLWGFILSFGLIWFIPKTAFVPGIILSVFIYFILSVRAKKVK